jgi:protein pelota
LKICPRIQNKNKNLARFVVLVPEEPEDMWHAYNLIAVGDLIKASTIRKV